MGWTGEFMQQSHKTFKLSWFQLKMLPWNLITNNGLCFPSQYFPSAPYFAANNKSFYKVMSNVNGYKHLHYVNAVSNVLLISELVVLDHDFELHWKTL